MAETDYLAPFTHVTYQPKSLPDSNIVLVSLCRRRVHVEARTEEDDSDRYPQPRLSCGAKGKLFCQTTHTAH